MRTNLEMLRDLDEVYTPSTKGVVNIHEIYLINERLRLDDMDKLQLSNLRDMVVMFYDSIYLREYSREHSSKFFEVMDKVSAITSVIDLKISNLGGEV